MITASEVHDPSSPGGNVGLGAGLGDLSGFAADGQNFQMIDGSEYNADKAYKDSKLCNVLFAKELRNRLQETNSQITVNAFGPGLITRTGTYFPITTFRLCDCPYETDTFGFYRISRAKDSSRRGA